MRFLWEKDFGPRHGAERDADVTGRTEPKAGCIEMMCWDGSLGDMLIPSKVPRESWSLHARGFDGDEPDELLTKHALWCNLNTFLN